MEKYRRAKLLLTSNFNSRCGVGSNGNIPQNKSNSLTILLCPGLLPKMAKMEGCSRYRSKAYVLGDYQYVTLVLFYRWRLNSSQGLSDMATPILEGALTTFGSYSAERVTRDFGLHSCWHRSPTFPELLNLVFSNVEGSRAWELPTVK